MCHATDNDGEIYIHGSSVNKVNLLFETPIKSSYLNIFTTTETNTNEIKLYSVHKIKCKFVAIIHNSLTIFIPLLHTY